MRLRPRPNATGSPANCNDLIKQQIFSISASATAARMLWLQGHAEDAREAVENIQHSAREEAQVEMQALLQQLRPAPLNTPPWSLALMSRLRR